MVEDDTDDAVNAAIDELVALMQDGDHDKAAALVRRWAAQLPPKMDAETLLMSVCWLGQAVARWLAPHLKLDPTTIGAAMAQEILTGTEPPPSLFEKPPPDAAHRRRP
jgi:hypothetical protein